MRTLTSDFQLSASHSAERPARDSGVDLVKSAAILFVILIHVSGGALGATAAGTIPWLESLLWNSAARSAVPLFLLCSGAILLNPARGVTARHIWQRNIPHILLALFFWAAVYQALSFAEDGGLRQEALRAGLLSLLRWDHESHLYFLQIMLLVYAAFPITRTFMDHADEKTQRYALLFWLVCGVALPMLKAVCKPGGGVSAQWPLPMVWAAIGCTALGELLRRRPLPAGLAAGMAAIGFSVCFFGTWLLSVRAGALRSLLLEGFSLGPVMMAAGLFSLGMRTGERLPARCARAAQTLSRSSFCVYLVHIAVLRALYRAGLSTGFCRPLLSVPALSALCFTISFLLWLPLSRLPFVRRWLI